jgi:signal transduction histidine kinase
VGWSVAQLDRSLIVEELLPALFESHFAGGNPPPYRVAVAAAEQPHKIIYQSDVFSEDDLASADLVLDLLSEADGHLRINGPQLIHIDAPETPQWRLFVRHRMGSLDAAVDDLRRRNLAIGAAILLVLAASAILVVISASRARKLGRMQVESAAAISHELRTPLAVIRAAAYNLEAGVIEDRSQVRHYASVVQGAGRRLSKMVDQILLFAETQARTRRSIAQVNIQDVIDKTLDEISVTFPAGHARVDKEIPDDLPLVSGDALLLSHCVQNLLSNALKYGESKPVTISVKADRKVQEVQICVTDQGPGISQLDMPHIFKPFYRGKSGELDPTGNGLGLALVRRLMDLQHGRVSVETGPYCGTTFTLHVSIA